MAETDILPTSRPAVDTGLAHTTREEWVGVAHDTIAVDRTDCGVGDTVRVTWEIRSCPLHDRDFIGMFEVGENAQPGHSGVDGDHRSTGRVTMDGLLESRLRGDTSISSGLLQWTIQEDLFQASTLESRYGLVDLDRFSISACPNGHIARNLIGRPSSDCSIVPSFKIVFFSYKIIFYRLK